MRCVMCGGQTMATPHQRVALDVGLPGVEIDDISIHTCTACGERYDELPPLEPLMAYITGVIAARPNRLTGAEIRFLRKRLGWSSKDFAKAFCVEPTTVSKWENDKLKLDPFKDKMLRQFARRGPMLTDYSHDTEGGAPSAPPPFRIYVPDFSPKGVPAGRSARRIALG